MVWKSMCKSAKLCYNTAMRFGLASSSRGYFLCYNKIGFYNSLMFIACYVAYDTPTSELATRWEVAIIPVQKTARSIPVGGFGVI